jgi:hypothetical protein
MDSVAYEEYLREAFVKHDSLCRRCGECCGAGKDPCRNLAREENGMYKCLVYENRLGPQKTISGKFFTCVPIKDNIRTGFSNPTCIYIN